MSDDRAHCYPVRESFSRQQVHERTGIADDVLAFWIKQGLLVPLPAERRAHRRFSYEQLHIAAYLNALRSIGANVGVLRKFATMFQDGFVRWRSSGLDPASLRSAITLCEALDKFAAGEPVKIRISADDYRREGIARFEQEVVQAWLWEEAREGASLELAVFAKSLTIQMARNIHAALWITEPGYLALDEHSERTTWIAWIDGLGDPRLATEGENILRDENAPTAAFYVAICQLIARLWPERIEPARKRYKIQQHNSLVRHLIDLEARDPGEARAYRRRMGIPDAWAEEYGIIELEDGDDMTG